jgi:hypothetical protein
MRIRVIDVLQLLAAGESPADLLAQYPYLVPEGIQATLLYAARRLDHPHLAAKVPDPIGGAAPRVWIDAQLPPLLATWLASHFGIAAVYLERKVL